MLAALTVTTRPPNLPVPVMAYCNIKERIYRPFLDPFRETRSQSSRRSHFIDGPELRNNPSPPVPQLWRISCKLCVQCSQHLPLRRYCTGLRVRTSSPK